MSYIILHSKRESLFFGFGRITGITLGRTRLEKRVVSQDLELWLSNVSAINFSRSKSLLCHGLFSNTAQL